VCARAVPAAITTTRASVVACADATFLRRRSGPGGRPAYGMHAAFIPIRLLPPEAGGTVTEEFSKSRFQSAKDWLTTEPNTRIATFFRDLLPPLTKAAGSPQRGLKARRIGVIFATPTGARPARTPRGFF